ncbi:MAG: transporter [Fluviicola sp.]|nr:MAG: transporter [Fluviicola sp.]
MTDTTQKKISFVLKLNNMEFWDTEYYGNTLLDYTISLGIILGTVIAAKLLYWLSKNVIKKMTQKTKTNLDDIIVDMVEEPVVFGLVLWGTWYALGLLNYPVSELSAADIEEGIKIPYSHTRQFVNHLFNFLLVINITWLIARVVDALIEEYIVPLTEKTESDLDDQLLPLFRKGLKIIVWTMGIVVGLNNAGYNVGAIIAGLGIGGLAFALAAQDTVKNFFGGIMIFADKPFKIGERIQIGDIDGFVEEIGIRSTRIKTLAGRLVTIPNSMFSEDAIENIDKEPTRKVVLNLGLTYETTSEQMEQAMQLLKDISASHTDKINEEVLVSFNSFGDFSLGILFIYYIRKEADILDTQSAMNLDILKKFNAAGLDMAFPTQTVYHQAVK